MAQYIFVLRDYQEFELFRCSDDGNETIPVMSAYFIHSIPCGAVFTHSFGGGFSYTSKDALMSDGSVAQVGTIFRIWNNDNSIRYEFEVSEVVEEEDSCVDGLVQSVAYRLHDDSVNVPVFASDVSKEYDGVGWSFPIERKNFNAGDGTAVPVVIQYSPSSTPKDVSGEGEYEITAMFEIDRSSVSANYYLAEETKTFTAHITPKQIDIDSCPEDITEKYNAATHCVLGLGVDVGGDIIPGDDVSVDFIVSGAEVAYRDGVADGFCVGPDAGVYRVDITYTLSGSDAKNYELGSSSCFIVVNIEPYPITFPCIFGDDVVQEKVYDGQPFSLPTTDSIVTFQTTNENTGEVDEEVVTLQIIYDSDISDQTGVFGPVRVSATYTGMDAYPNYDITVPGECFATFEITCRPLTVDISKLSFPDVTEYFDSCGTLKVPVGTNITSEVRGMDTEGVIGNVVEGEDVPVTLTAIVDYFEGWSYPFNPTTDYRVAYGILLSFEHSDSNYCDIPDKLYVYRAVNASCWVEIEPFGAEWYNSKYNGPVTVGDVYYPESFTFVIKCKRYCVPDTIVWDDSVVVYGVGDSPILDRLTYIKSEPENCYEADCYYSFTINTSPRSEGGHLIAHSLKCHWLNGKIREDYVNIDGDFIPRFRFFGAGNSAYLEPFTLTDHLGLVAPVLGIGHLNQQSSFYDADYDGREHCPVVCPSFTAERYIYLSGDTGTYIDIDEEAYWCWIDDEWVANYKIKDAGVYPINRFQQNATNNTEITGGNPHWIGLYGDGTATIHKITLTISSFKITKKWDGGTEIEVDVSPRNISGWAYGDSGCKVIAHGTFPSSDIGEYLVSEDNGVDVSFGVSCSPSNYVIERAVFDGEIIPSATLFDLFFVDEEGNADVTVVCDGNVCSTVYDAKTHYVTVRVKEFEEGELSPGMVEWINGVTIEADKLLWTVNEGEEEETVEGEERVGKLHAGTYLISGYMDFGGSYDLIGQVTFTIGRRPLYLENLTVSYS